MTPAWLSANSSGPQSAVDTPMASRGVPRDDGVGARPTCMRPGLIGHHHVGRMDLIGRDQAIRRHAERCGHAGAVFGDLVGRIVRADAAIERGIDALRHAAVACEEGVANARELGERRGLQHTAGSYSNPGGTPTDGCAKAATLNSMPMPVRPWPISRASAEVDIGGRGGRGLGLERGGTRARFRGRRRNCDCSIGPKPFAPIASTARASA